VGQAVGVVSNRVKSTFTPAGSAFTIWGVIYTLAVLCVIFLAWKWKDSFKNFGRRTYITLSVNFLLNGVWIFLWTGAGAGSAILWTSVVFMVGILATLIMVYRWAGAASARASSSWAESLCVRTFLSVYLGWISVAIIANVAGAATPVDGATPGWGLGAATWASVMLSVAGILALAQATLYFDVGYPAVIAWASWWVSVQQSEPNWPGDDNTVGVARTVFGVAIFAVVIALGGGLYRMLSLKQPWQPAWPSIAASGCGPVTMYAPAMPEDDEAGEALSPKENPATAPHTGEAEDWPKRPAAARA